MEDPQLLLAAILEWAGDDPRVRGVVQTGSRGRNLRVDSLSDLDIELIGDFEALAADDTWYHRFSEVLVCLSLPNDGMPSRLVVFRHGRKVDFFLRPMSWIEDQVSGGLSDLYDAGYRVLLDESGRLEQLPPARNPAPARPLPDEAAFQAVVDEFWFEATQVSTYVARDEFWVVKFRENTMHECLLRMLEWRAWTAPHPPPFTGYIGNRIHEWLDASSLVLARNSFSRATADDTWRALGAGMRLFDEASSATAARLGFAPRLDIHKQVLELHEQIRQLDVAAGRAEGS